MNYYVARGGQTYGPYSEETIRKYVTEGSMSASDMGCTDAAPTWVALSQLLGPASAPPPQQPVYTAPPPVYSTPPQQQQQPPQQAYTPPVYQQPTYNQPPNMMGQAGAMGTIPPSLHWALILVIAAFTGGIFITIWIFIQANWVKTIDPASRAIRDLIIAIFMPLIGVVILVIMIAAGAASGIAASGLDRSVGPGLGAAAVGSMVLGGLLLCALSIVGFIFHLKAFFGMRDSMQRYYNTTEPINLRLSAVMTFFFNTLYFQYHMSRIADWKRTGFLRP